MTGYEEPELLNIKCKTCNNTGAIQTSEGKWVDCLICYGERYEKKQNLQKLVGGEFKKRGVN